MELAIYGCVDMLDTVIFSNSHLRCIRTTVPDSCWKFSLSSSGKANVFGHEVRSIENKTSNSVRKHFSQTKRALIRLKGLI